MKGIGAPVRAWVQAATAAGLLGPEGFGAGGQGAQLLFPRSVKRRGAAVFALLRVAGVGLEGPAHARDKALGLLAPAGAGEGLEGFEGESLSVEGGRRLMVGPLSHRNAQALRQALPFTAPSPLAEQAVTIGVGDRLGVAGPGHLRLFARRAAAPVLAQQSVRELELTGRSYEEVLDASTWAVFQEGFERPWGADGDHLKSEEWVRTAVGIGFTMITADVSDYIHGEYAAAGPAELSSAYAPLPAGYRCRIEETYLPLRLELDTGAEVRFALPELTRTALIYREAIEHALRLYRAAEGAGVDFELSVDETATPTTLEAHAFVALEARAAGVRLSSLAPRFVGEFQKGIDYLGDLNAFERCLADHAALARRLGYRISVHSGSDKFRVFPLVGRLTEGRFHLKTAGTNWLEAVRVLARRDPGLYRELYARALAGFSAATRYYHISTRLDDVPALGALEDRELPGLLDDPHARQLVHITYGELLRDRAFRKRFFSALERHVGEYWQGLGAHLGRHLDALGVQELGVQGGGP
ncbi:MAG: hypothetical protein JW820_18290 [Spirochaetales bacterium]|nr:hypothetical protein [Spirochaetales bacterium]